MSVREDVINGTVSICAEIAALPGELQTDLTVTLFTTNGTKAGWYCSCSVNTLFLKICHKHMSLQCWGWTSLSHHLHKWPSPVVMWLEILLVLHLE